MFADSKKDFPWFSFLGLNIFITTIIILLQYFYYVFAPSITYYYEKPFKDNFDKKAACIEVASKFNKPLITELIAGSLILLLLNYFLLRRKSQRILKITLIALLVYILFTGANLAYLTNSYIERNMMSDF